MVGLVRSSNETDEGDVDSIIGGWIVPRGDHKYMASSLQRVNDVLIVGVSVTLTRYTNSF